MTFPTEFNDLLYGDKKPLLYLATLMEDGSPQVTPVWFDTDGDYILVEQTENANNQDIVVALLRGEETTLKRFFREPAGKVRLQPANAQMEPIVVPARDLKIQGRVIGVLRKY